MVQLKIELLFRRWWKRLVFYSPNDNNKVIKILKPGLKNIIFKINWNLSIIILIKKIETFHI